MPQTDWLEQQTFVFFPGGWKAEMKVPAGAMPSAASLPGLQAATCLPCAHAVFALCACVPVVYVSDCSAQEDAASLDEGQPSWPPFKLISS